MKAVILAGGRGTRLAPYTSVLPKPLMPVGEHSILEIVLGQLSRAGVTDITLCVGYLSHLIRAVIDDHVGDSIRVNYVHEDDPLGTAAPLRLVDGLDETFLVMNGDVLTTLDYADLVARHREQGNVLTIATHERRVKIDYGIVHADDQDRIVEFEEKPEIPASVSMGVYVMEPEALEHIPAAGYVDFPELVNRLLEAGRPVARYPYDGLWFDIGRHDDFEQAVAVWTANGEEYEAADHVLHERQPTESA